MNGAQDFIGRLSRLGGIAGQAAMVVMVVSIFYDVMMRYVFAAPTHWAMEVNTFLLLFLCTIPTADVLGADVHIRVTFLTQRWSPRTLRRLDGLRGVAGILLCAVMTWKGTVMTWQAWAHNDRMSTALGTPMFIPYLCLPVGFVLLGLRYAALIAARPSSPPEAAKAGQQI